MGIQSKYCTLYIVRHGQTKANVNKILAGTTDVPLAEEGAKQAKERARDFTKVQFDAVFASDLSRAKRTAEIIALEKKLAVNATHLLRERHFGDWEGRPEEKVFAENAELLASVKNLSEQEKRDFKFNPTYESDTEVSGRFIIFLRELAIAHLGQTLLVVTHGSMMRTLLVHLGFASYDELPMRSIINTGYFILESDGVDFFIKKTFGVNKVKTIN